MGAGVLMSKETEIGGQDGRFHTTVWSEILAAGGPSQTAARPHLDRFIRDYWKPVYSYVRHVWGAGPEEAKDLTQDFFGMLLERRTWAQLDPDRGSFRAYLKTALRHFLINAKKHAAVRAKVRPVLSLDSERQSLDDLVPVAAGEPLDGLFDAQWVRCLIDHATEQLRGDLEREGKRLYFEVFRAYCMDSRPPGVATPPIEASGAEDENGPTYREVGARLGVKESDVRNYLTYCRRRIWKIFLDRIREYTASEEDARRELDLLLGEGER